MFDGHRLQQGLALRFAEGRLQDIVPEDEAGEGERIDVDGDILSHGYVDLQVNGGGGVMLNDAPSVDALRQIAIAHRSLGTVALLPTLITDTRETTQAAIAAARAAVEAGVAGIAGLHLEGPHLSIARKGAHDAALIRPMEDSDLNALLEAARVLPALKVTVAPENTTPEQVATLARAGVRVALGHTDADYDTCVAYAQAGASCVTHLFNAMSQLGNRAPGVVGAALDCDGLSAGLIADGIHVHPASIRAAWAAKAGSDAIYLVSDAMAVAGTGLSEFHLNGRLIRRRDRTLRLEDGTLAGADLDLTTAVRILTNDCGVTLTDALAAATRVPAQVIGQAGVLRPDHTPQRNVIRIRPDLSAANPIAT
ncbi:MAG: N-acetylglucosamine-6-phosphate deacetylase [Paracoccaceae bacterium]